MILRRFQQAGHRPWWVDPREHLNYFNGDSLARLLAIVGQALESGEKKPKPPLSQVPAPSEPIGNSPLMQVLRGKAEQAAQRDLPVLITGEPGSGRENLARFIHRLSTREGEFVTVDRCELAEEHCRSYLLGKESDDVVPTRELRVRQ